MKFIELFAGIGGMGYGLMKAGMECVGFVEWDKYAHKAFKLLHDPDERMWARHDITAVTDVDIRLLGQQHSIDLISGGFPCQSFSIAGKRQGFADKTRGTLFFEIVRFASILKPKHLLLENVKGLLNHDGGRTFATIICALDELGYDIEWQLLNSKDYGVPQNRERVFIVGHSRTGSRREVFPISGENSETDSETKIIVAGSLEYYGNDQMNRIYDTQGLAPTLNARKGGNEPKVISVGVNTIPDIKCVNPRKEDGTQTYQHDRIYDVNGIMVSLAVGNHGRQNVAIPNNRIGGWVERDDRIFAYQNDKKRSTAQEHIYIKPEGTTDALTVGHRPKMIDRQYRIRKLTPVECFRLQSYPDHWYTTLKEAGISDSQLYKMAGNGVTSNVAYEIGKRLNAAGETARLQDAV